MTLYILFASQQYFYFILPHVQFYIFEINLFNNINRLCDVFKLIIGRCCQSCCSGNQFWLDLAVRLLQTDGIREPNNASSCCLFHLFCLFSESSELHSSNRTGLSISLWPGCFGGQLSGSWGELSGGQHGDRDETPPVGPQAPLRSLSDWGSDHLVLDGIAAPPAAPQMESSSSGLLWLSVGAEWLSVRLFHPPGASDRSCSMLPPAGFLYVIYWRFFFFFFAVYRWCSVVQQHAAVLLPWLFSWWDVQDRGSCCSCAVSV